MLKLIMIKINICMKKILCEIYEKKEWDNMKWQIIRKQWNSPKELML
jgi:hypothetical protein